MDFFQILVLTLHITHVFTRSKSRSKSKKYRPTTSEEESIENLLYYKDCQRKGKEETSPTPEPMKYEMPPPAPPPPPPPPRQPDCPFPKMCCALTCGNECDGNSQPSFISRQMEPVSSMQQLQPFQPIAQPRQPGMGAVQPQIVQRRKKKLKFPQNKMQPPIGNTRRDFGFSKEKIKSLISQDDDIRKILKDLVRVTMQKVDLLDKINSKRSVMETTVSPQLHYDEYDE